MNALKKLGMGSILMAFLLLLSCKQAEEKKLVYPENEIPVSTSSEEALNEFKEGLKIFDEGNSLKARPYFEKALELDPNFVSAQMYRAFTSTSAKEWAENREKTLAMRDQANESEQVLIDLMVANMEGNNAKQLELSESLVAMNPNSARAMDYLAGYYNGMDDTEKARELWKKAHEMDTDFIPVISTLGGSYLLLLQKTLSRLKTICRWLSIKRPIVRGHK